MRIFRTNLVHANISVIHLTLLAMVLLLLCVQRFTAVIVSSFLVRNMVVRSVAA